jgi:P-type Cu+ transporter
LSQLRIIFISALMEDIPVKEKIVCYHCGEDCPSDNIIIDEKYFCCNGCKTVFEILNGNNLCNYYELEKAPGSPPSGYTKTYEYLDDENVINNIISFQNSTTAYVNFYIPRIHCSSCIWILENLYKLNQGIFHSEVNFLEKSVLIKYKKDKISLKGVVEILASIGYEPLIQLDSMSSRHKTSDDKKLLYKLGIAGFCFGNIMLLSFPEYLSIGESEVVYRKLFGYLNFLLSLPVLIYSASDYFISAFASLKKKIININLPLSIGIGMLFLRSCFEIFTSAGAGYFDSMAGLVFLLLIGKYIQQRTYSSLNFERDYTSYLPLSVIRKTGVTKVSVPVTELKQGDRILIRHREIIPGDSILISDTACIDYSFLTGESQLNELRSGELVYAGGRQEGNLIELEIVKEVSQSYLTRLWNNPAFDKERHKHFTHFTNKISRHFTAGIIIIAIISALLWLPDLYMAMNVFTAVLIVACPCALALSVPFTYGNALRIFGRNKFYFKNSLRIEDLARADAVVFDKTGTITESRNSGIKYCGRDLTIDEKNFVKSITGISLHPLSRMISESITAAGDNRISDYKEIPGKGIEAGSEGNIFKIGTGINENGPEINTTKVHLLINNIYAGFYEVSNSYRSGILDEIKELKKNYKIFLLSGDSEGEKENLLPYFKEDSNLLFRQSPQDKLDFVKRLQSEGSKVLMIGDGLNDAGALSQSDFGISVTDDISNFSPACDAILDSSSLNRISYFLKFSKDSNIIIYTSFAVSLLYNIGGLAFAVSGMLTPLVAAVLMPLSSLTVFAIAAAGTTITARKRRLCL